MKAKFGDEFDLRKPRYICLAHAKGGLCVVRKGERVKRVKRSIFDRIKLDHGVFETSSGDKVLICQETLDKNFEKVERKNGI